MNSYGTINGRALYYSPESSETFLDGEENEYMEYHTSDRTTEN